MGLMIMMIFLALMLVVVAAVSFPLAGFAFQLSMPLECEVGETCFVQQYVDLDPSSEATDFTCGKLSYDGHKGTDFRVKNRSFIAKGVNVLAAADGNVRGMRDGMADISIRDGGTENIKGRECGNAVVLRHPNGWETQYCHLKKGSVTVRTGDAVKAGQVIGQLGMSGSTEFPHMHLSVRKDGKVVDPFIGLTEEPACGQARRPLWDSATFNLLRYQRGGILDTGFTDAKPAYADIKQGKHKSTALSSDAPLMIVWTHVYGLDTDMKLGMTLISPNGELLAENDSTPDRHKAQYFQFIGKKRPAGGWPKGTYKAAITLETKSGDVVATRDVSLSVE